MAMTTSVVHCHTQTKRVLLCVLFFFVVFAKQSRITEGVEVRQSLRPDGPSRTWSRMVPPNGSKCVAVAVAVVGVVVAQNDRTGEKWHACRIAGARAL
uniref:Putative secreted protein n=1 Tax=Anopheles marajoara TaxID=58244 RepID=A0A2M4C8Z8_9DIPT